MAGAAVSSRSLDAFRYLHADKAEFYRRIMDLFAEARQRYQLYLRPRDLRQLIGGGQDEDADDDVDAALNQLCEWGNLDKHADTAEVQTVAQFNRPRYLYSLTPTGAAAHQAVEHFFALLQDQGKLDTGALHDVREHLHELAAVLGTAPLDQGKGRRLLRAMMERFTDLAREAQTFLQKLQRSIELQTLELQAFIQYKQMLIDYLEHFIHELLLAQGEIAQKLAGISDEQVGPLLTAVARDESEGRFNPQPTDLASLADQWRSRWQGLKTWFQSSPGQPAQVLQLRARARAAIPALLEAIAGINERRVTRSDRSADLKILARWFIEAESDEVAHRLWRGAFGLDSCRHLRIDAQTLAAQEEKPVSPRTSWLEAPAIRISPRLRRTGRYQKPGPPPAIIDNAEQQRRLRHRARDEAAQYEAARRHLLDARATRLSDLAQLDQHAFALLLDLLATPWQGSAIPRRPLRPAPLTGA